MDDEGNTAGRLSRELDRERNLRRAIATLCEALLSPSAGVPDLARSVLESARAVTNSEHGFVSSIAPDTGEMVPHTFTQMMGDQCSLPVDPASLSFSRGADGRYPGLWGHALNAPQAFYTNDPAGHPACQGVPTGHIALDSLLAAPAMLGDEVVGQVALANCRRGYTAWDLEAVQRLSDLYALALQRRRNEEILQASESKFRIFAEQSVDTLFSLSTERRITYLSPSSEQVTGHRPAEVLGKPWAFAGPLLGVELAEQAWQQLLAGESLRALEFPYQRADGTPAFLEISATPTRQDDRIVGIHGILRDITERRRTMARQRALVDNMAFLERTAMEMVEFPSDGDLYRYIAERVLHIVGDHCRVVVNELDPESNTLRPRALIGLDDPIEATRRGVEYVPEDLIAETSPEAFRAMSTARLQVIDGGLPTLLGGAAHGDLARAIGNALNVERVYLMGIVRQHRIHGSVCLLATRECGEINAPLLEAFVRQATVALEHHRAERERERVARLLKENPSPVLRVSAETTILYANPAGLSMLSSLGSGIGQELPEELGQLVATARQSGARQEADLSSGGRLYSFVIAPVPDKDYVNLFGRDVTEHRELEAQFRQAHKMEAIGKLAGGIAHDFNNMLCAIVGYADVVGRSLKKDDPLRKDVQYIKTAGERAAALTGQLLAFSRRQVLELKVLDLNQVVLSTDRMLRRLIGEDIELITVLAPDLGKVRADPGQIEQVILNLAVNARDAMPGGGKLSLTTSEVQVSEASSQSSPELRPGSYVTLAVADTGSGMDEHVLAQVFEPFFTTKDVGEGTGLGLATVYGIVKQSEGHLTAQSTVGQGSTFTIYLQRVDGDEEQDARWVPAEELPRGHETVLVAEDEDMLRELVVRALRGAGYQVLEARTGGDALPLCQDHPGPVDLLVTDVVMPLMSGPRLAELLVRQRPSMKVLFTSGYSGESSRSRLAVERGAPFLQKPFAASALLRKVRAVLDGGRSSPAPPAGRGGPHRT